MSEFLNLLVAGLTSGAIYGIFGACLAVWFRVCNVLNLAVGDFAMFGAIGTAWLVQNAGLPFIAGIVVDLAGVGLAAWLFDWVVLHPAFDRGRGARGIVGVFFYTFGLSLVLEGVARAWFGTDVWGAPAIWSGPALSVLDFHVQRAGILVIALAIVSGLALWAYLRFTVSGRAASACGESMLGSRIVGIDTAKFRRRIFIATAVLAALFGIVESPLSGYTYAERADDQPDRDRRRGVRVVPPAGARGGDRAGDRRCRVHARRLRQHQLQRRPALRDPLRHHHLPARGPGARRGTRLGKARMRIRPARKAGDGP